MAKVEVRWVDAIIDPSNEGDFKTGKGPEDFGHIVEYLDIGYLVRYNPSELILAVSRCPKENDYRHSNAIPTKMIVDVTLLEAQNGREQEKEPSGATPRSHEEPRKAGGEDF